VEGVAWWRSPKLDGLSYTTSSPDGPYIIYHGGTIFVEGMDFTEKGERGRPVRVIGKLKRGIYARFGNGKLDYYIQPRKFQSLDAISDPHLVLSNEQQ
jgi:hypothetical protein